MILGRKHNPKAWLVPYAEGTLDAARAAHLEAQIARDPALALEARRVRATTARLRAVAAQNPAEADPRLALDPASLWPAVRPRLAAAAPRHRPRPALWAGGACAAGLALAALLLHGVPSGVSTAPLPPAPFVRVAAGDPVPVPPAISARTRRKKAGHRIPARPASALLLASKTAPPARVAVLPLAAPLPLDPPALPDTPMPVPATPHARTAVALGSGSAQFRLASPVPAVPPGDSVRRAAASTADQDDTDTSARPASPDSTAPARIAAAPVPEIEVSAPAAPPPPARKARQHRHRHHARHRHAAPAAATPAASSAVVPLPLSSNPRVL